MLWIPYMHVNDNDVNVMVAACILVASAVAE
jgi:hypothetical protein